MVEISCLPLKISGYERTLPQELRLVYRMIIFYRPITIYASVSQILDSFQWDRTVSSIECFIIHQFVYSFIYSTDHINSQTLKGESLYTREALGLDAEST
jgi:hypothetical protein